eukprot:gene11004-13016_t
MAVNAFGEAGKVAARRRSNFLVSFVSDNKRNSQIESENKRSSQIDGGNKRSSTVSMADEHEVDEGIEDVDNEAVEKEAEQVLQRCQEQRRTSLKQMLSTRLERRPSVVDVMERNVLQMDVTTIDTTGTTGDELHWGIADWMEKSRICADEDPATPKTPMTPSIPLVYEDLMKRVRRTPPLEPPAPLDVVDCGENAEGKRKSDEHPRE